MSSNNIGTPFPPHDGGVIGKVIKIIKTIFSIFKKPAKEAGDTDSINDNSSLENIERITQIISDFKEQVHVKAVEIENAVMQEVDYYIEELHDILDNNLERVYKYGIHIKSIEKQIDRISNKVKGTIDNELSRKVSLDNVECKNIIKMIPGEKKESAMNNFLQAAVSGALEVCCNEIQENLEEIYNEVESEIIGTVESIQKQNEILQESFNSIDENSYEMTAKNQMVRAYYLTDVCDTVVKIL